MVTTITISIDSSGRLVLPKEVRDRFHLVGGSRLAVRIEGAGVVLLPEQAVPVLEVREGVLVFRGEAEGDILGSVERTRKSRVRDMMGPVGQ
jgi:AbrB family looped-hinge helix DNA binding protein